MKIRILLVVVVLVVVVCRVLRGFVWVCVVMFGGVFSLVLRKVVCSLLVVVVCGIGRLVKC